MATATKRRNRESHGPTPHSVAIFARPSLSKPAEHLILERRKREEVRDLAVSQVEYNKQFDLKSTWERATDKKIQRNTVNRRVDEIMAEREAHLDARREKLRIILSTEEYNYIEEMKNKEETVLERQARMRERAKQLKEQRESERLKTVEEKLDQRWRAQCEELRSVVSKQTVVSVSRERQQQLKLKEEARNRQHEEEEFYADMWDKDRQAKMKREELEIALQHERNTEMVQILNIQLASLEEQRLETKRLKEQEAELCKEQEKLRKLEDERRQQEKKEEQQETRRMLAASLRMKMKKRAREVQEQLAIDMKILEDLLEQTRNEAQSQLQRKKELREEMLRYREHLEAVRKEEEKRERELDEMLNNEMEKMWQKRVQQWKKEREARKKLMSDVLKSREQQVKERLEINWREQEAAWKERDEILRNIEEHRLLEAEQIAQIKDEQKRYQMDLLQQIEYQRLLKEREQMEEQREFELGQEAEMEYKRRLVTAVEKTPTEKQHPMRMFSPTVDGKHRRVDV